MNKGGWIHILEATIAVLIVAGVMVSVYDDQSAREVLSVEDYSYSLQNEILDGIAENRSLRLDAMNVVVDLPTDPHYDVLDSYVAAKIPGDFGYLLRVCNLGDPNDYCKMPPVIFYATIDRDVFVEETVVSAEVGEGVDAEYSPKKLRLFFWEGGFPEDYCSDECDDDRAPVFCSSDSTQVLRNECDNFETNDSCLESGPGTEVVEVCGSGNVCVDGECVFSLYSKLTCKFQTWPIWDACDVNPVTYCAAYDGWAETGDCHSGSDDEYSCFLWVYANSTCSENPVCPSGYTSVSSTPCTLPVCVDTSWTPLTNTICAGTPFTQTSNCGTTQSAMGTKNCVASLSASYSNLCKNCGSPPPGFGGGNWWYYDVTLSETGGDVGVTISSRQVCETGSVSGYNCGPVRTDIATWYGTNYIPAGGSIVRDDMWTWTDEASWSVTETFWGTDGNNNPVTDSYGFTTN